MTTGLLHALRGIHILAGSFWLGAAVMNTFFLAPAIRASGPAGGGVMRQLMQVRRLPIWMNAAAWLTILSGVWLYGWRSSWFTSAWMTSGPGIVYALGGVLALAAALIGGLIIARTARRMGVLGASIPEGQGPPPPDVADEMQRLQRTMYRAGMAATVLIILATLCMAVGRYT